MKTEAAAQAFYHRARERQTVHSRTWCPRATAAAAGFRHGQPALDGDLLRINDSISRLQKFQKMMQTTQ